MKIHRREFLSTAAASTAGVLLAGNAVVAAEQKAAPADIDPTASVPLGKTLNACRISCGTGMGGGGRQTNQTRLGKEKFEALLNYAYDHGIRQFDMADMYGTHPYVGRVLEGKPRDKVQLVSKIWTRRGGLPEPERPLADVLVKRFLKELQTDYIDVLQIHCMTDADWNEKERRQMDAMEKLKEQGLIRAHGVSVHSLEALKTAAKESWVDVVHARINPFGHRTDVGADEIVDKVVPVLEQIHAAGKGIIGMKLIGEGKFDPQQRKAALKFVMELGSVDCMTIGFEQTAQIDEFLANVRQRLTAKRG
ncbi:MAG: aldo/keto reductase [Candidatus Nealsonbacteria bacterium]|nr:aldo/keto reductase [Candidatus Nealsonbacteria bacterium]